MRGITQLPIILHELTQQIKLFIRMKTSKQSKTDKGEYFLKQWTLGINGVIHVNGFTPRDRNQLSSF